MSPRSLKTFLFRNLANLITFGRIPLCFASLACAVVVLKDPHTDPLVGFLGEILLILSALTDYFDGYVARKFNVISKIGPLADQVMDKIVYCITFPTLAVGIMFKDGNDFMAHAILALGLCVTLLVRDHYVNFLRTIADRHNADSSVKKIGKIRTLWALPTACVMYAYCFSTGELEDLAYLNALFVWVQIDGFTTYLIILELSLFIINIVSAISYTNTYGTYLLEEITEGDTVMRKKILAIFPNSLTLMNAIMGISAMILAWNEKFHLSFVLLLVASIFDKLDGAAARKLGLTEEISEGRKITLGMILDDIADLISFCIAPAVVAHAYLQNASYAPFLYLYALLGLARLIYFTLDKTPIPGYFKGLPSPAAAILVGGIVHFSQSLSSDSELLHMIVFCSFILTGIIMNSYFIRYIHFGKVLSRNKTLSKIMFLIILGSVFSKDFLGLIAILIMGAYLSSPLFVKPKANEEVIVG